MNRIELAARRAALGLTQTELARVLGVKQETVSRWETGRRTPGDPSEIEERIRRLEEIQNNLIDELCEIIEHSSGVLDSPTVILRVFESDEDYWASDARGRDGKIPAALHRSAAVWAARICAEEDEIVVRISNS